MEKIKKVVTGLDEVEEEKKVAEMSLLQEEWRNYEEQGL